MPSRTAPSPGTIPGRFARLGRFPEREVQRISFLFARLNAYSRLELVEIAPRQLGVLGIRSDRKIHVPLRFVGEPALDQRPNERDDLRQVIAHLRRDVRLDQSQRPRIFPELFHEARCQRDRVLAAIAGCIDDLVVDVGEIADVGDLEAAVAQIADDDIESGEGPRIADVDEVVDRGTSHIDAELSRFEWNELFLPPGQRVEHPDRWCAQAFIAACPLARRLLAKVVQH